jgi:hypothetical protein
MSNFWDAFLAHKLRDKPLEGFVFHYQNGIPSDSLVKDGQMQVECSIFKRYKLKLSLVLRLKVGHRKSRFCHEKIINLS